MNKNIFILIISVLCFSSCSLLRKNKTITSFNLTDSDKFLYEKILEANISPEWISLNSKITINKEDKETTISAQIRIRKDSLIWISVKAPLGIEVFRSMITPDSVYYMNRMNKTYFIKEISHLKDVVKTEIKYSQLQDILFASPKITNQSFDLATDSNTYTSKSENSIYLINSFYRIFQMKLTESENKSLLITFDNFKSISEIENRFFPSLLLIEVQSDEVFDAIVNYTKIEFNKKSNTSFNIPKSYIEIQ